MSFNPLLRGLAHALSAPPFFSVFQHVTRRADRTQGHRRPSRAPAIEGLEPRLCLSVTQSALFQIHTNVSTTVNIEVVVKHPINLKSNGLVPVVILSTATFDATKIDLSTLKLNGVAMARSSFQVQIGDVNRDGLPDITLNFHTRALVKAGVLGPGITTLDITGATTGGDTFDSNSAVLNIVPHAKPHHGKN